MLTVPTPLATVGDVEASANVNPANVKPVLVAVLKPATTRGSVLPIPSVKAKVLAEPVVPVVV